MLHIVLVEPEIPQNTGNIARTCAVTGAALHLVGPMGFRLEDKRLRHAGLDYWPYLMLSTYDSLSEFFEKNQGDFYFFSNQSPAPAHGCGLSRRVLPAVRKGIRRAAGEAPVPAPGAVRAHSHAGGFRSLNLANSVAIGAFEVLRQWDFPELSCSGELRNFDWAAAKAAHPDSEFL